MTKDQIAAKLDEFGLLMRAGFGKIDAPFAEVGNRLAFLEKHSVTRSDVHSALFRGLAFAAAATVATVVGLNALGPFP